jgi:hypothetical protein
VWITIGLGGPLPMAGSAYRSGTGASRQARHANGGAGIAVSLAALLVVGGGPGRAAGPAGRLCNVADQVEQDILLLEPDPLRAQWVVGGTAPITIPLVPAGTG